MSDIFREVDEEVKRDKVAQFVKKYANAIIGVMILVVVAVGGYRAYKYFEDKKAADAGARFETALQLASDGKADEAKAQFEALSKDAPAGYRQLARFRLAAELARTDALGGIKAFEALADDAGFDQNMRDLARVRAALLLVDTASFADLQKRLEPFVAPGQAWRMSAREALGLSAYRAGDAEKATKYLEMILIDPEATQAARQRAEILMSLVRAGPAQAK